MKKVLYITNIEVPYRVRFFNELAKCCDLTVLYEKYSVEKRDEKWARSAENQHKRKYLKKSGLLFSGLLKALKENYDVIIVGCYNSPVQMLAQLYMRLRKISYIINLDGEPFLQEKTLKTRLKKFFLNGAQQYLVAGEKAGESVKALVANKTVIPYYFSSLSETELEEHSVIAEQCKRNDTILVVGQYFRYKGMDVALEAARLDQRIQYKFVGMGSRTQLFINEHKIPPNVQIVPFLQKEELEKEYRSCGMLVLPSRQECWGLVINEAASFGMPIVSTWGSGAAVEFLADRYPQYLAKPGDATDLLLCIKKLIHSNDKQPYSQYLIETSERYSIERSVGQHLKVV